MVRLKYVGRKGSVEFLTHSYLSKITKTHTGRAWKLACAVLLTARRNVACNSTYKLYTPFRFPYNCPKREFPEYRNEFLSLQTSLRCAEMRVAKAFKLPKILTNWSPQRSSPRSASSKLDSSSSHWATSRKRSCISGESESHPSMCKRSEVDLIIASGIQIL